MDIKIYRDTAGDLWSRGGRPQGSGAFLAAAETGYRWQGPTTNTLGDIDRVYGPMQILESAELAIHLPGLLELIGRLKPTPCPRCDCCLDAAACPPGECALACRPCGDD